MITAKEFKQEHKFSDEADLQIACAKFLLNLEVYDPTLLWYSTANERKTNRTRGHKLKMMGVRKGVADLFVFNWKAYFEVKFGKNGQTESQKEFARKVRLAGGKYYVFWDFEQFLEALSDASGISVNGLQTIHDIGVRRRYTGKEIK